MTYKNYPLMIFIFLKILERRWA